MVIALEAIHSMATSKEKAMFIKLDLAKVYDRVSWEFLGGLDSQLCDLLILLSSY